MELYDQPYSDKEFSVGESLCAMDYARSSKMEIPAVQTLSTPIPSFASGKLGVGYLLPILYGMLT